MAIKEKLKQFEKDLGTNTEVENSVVFRTVVTITVIIAITSTLLVAEDAVFTAISSITLTILGSFVSFNRKNKKNWWIKLLLALFMLVAFANFLRDAIMNPYDPRIPLSSLLIWLQVLHSFDLPKRKDLNYSLFVALILICVTATISRDLIFGVFLLSFCVFALLSLLYNNSSRNKISQDFSMSKKQTIKSSVIPIITTIVGMGVVFLFMPRYQTMKIKTFPVSIKLPEIPSFKGQIKEKTSKQVKKQTINGKEVLSIQRNFNKDAYYGFSTELDLNFRGDLSDEVIIKLRSSESTYIRGMGFDLYDGKNWKMSQPFELKKIFSSNLPIITKMSYEIKRDLTTKHELIQTFYIEKEQSNLIFSSTYAEEVYFPSTYVMADKYGSLRSPVELEKGLTYSVVSSVPEFNPMDLRRLREPIYLSKEVYKSLRKNENDDEKIDKELQKLYKFNKHSVNYLNDFNTRKKALYIIDSAYLNLPNNILPAIYKLSEEITQKSKTQFDKVEAIRRYLMTNYKYNLKIPEFPEKEETVNYFLFTQKEGYCEHFATSMVVMLRSIGIPARLVTGFAPSAYNTITGYHEIKSSDAHAWVEAYFPMRGWVPFDPTPGYEGLMGTKKTSNVLAFSIISKITEILKSYIPDSVAKSFKNIFESSIMVLLNIFSFFAKIVLSLNLTSMLIIILIIATIILFGVFIIYKIKQKKVFEENEIKLKKIFNSKERIEAIKIYNDFISKLDILGYKYEDNYTLSEYCQNITKELKDFTFYFEEVSNKLYFLRYGYKDVTQNELLEVRNLIDNLIEKVTNHQLKSVKH